MNRYDSATTFNNDNLQFNPRLNSGRRNERKKNDDTDNDDEEYTLSKSHCKPHLPTPEVNDKKMRINIRLPSHWLKTAIEQQPLLPPSASPNNTCNDIDRSKIRR